METPRPSDRLVEVYQRVSHGEDIFTSKISPGRTSLIVAHRLATVERCDTVAFLEVEVMGDVWNLQRSVRLSTFKLLKSMLSMSFLMSLLFVCLVGCLFAWLVGCLFACWVRVPFRFWLAVTAHYTKFVFLTWFSQ